MGVRISSPGTLPSKGALLSLQPPHVLAPLGERSQEQHRSTHIPSHLQEKPSHAGFMGSSKACHSPCLTLQSRWCSISQTGGAGSILSPRGRVLLGTSSVPQPCSRQLLSPGTSRRELQAKQGTSTARLQQPPAAPQGHRSTEGLGFFFFLLRAAQLLPPVYYTLHQMPRPRVTST